MGEWSAYDRAAAAYDTSGEDDPAWRERYRRGFLDALPGRRVLDAGCGAGRDTAAFEAAGLELTGIDGSHEMLALARARCPRSRFVQGDFTRPGLEPGSFDGIWSMFALLHVPPAALPACLAAWRALLVPGGVVCLGMAASSKLAERTVADWLGVPGNSCTFYYHPPETTRSLLEAARFTVEALVADTPARYRVPAYEELGLSTYVVIARGEKVGARGGI